MLVLCKVSVISSFHGNLLYENFRHIVLIQIEKEFGAEMEREREPHLCFLRKHPFASKGGKKKVAEMFKPKLKRTVKYKTKTLLLRV